MTRSIGSHIKTNQYYNTLLGTAVICLNLATHFASLEVNGKFIKAIPQKEVAYQADQLRYLKAMTKMSWELI
ncbi:MAG: hypothetical protein J6J16_09755 [Lachnospiraceae bacterium]|nr:hypothetical protein [Lachnospiraceae bacterium]